MNDRSVNPKKRRCSLFCACVSFENRYDNRGGKVRENVCRIGRKCGSETLSYPGGFGNRRFTRRAVFETGAVFARMDRFSAALLVRAARADAA